MDLAVSAMTILAMAAAPILGAGAAGSAGSPASRWPGFSGGALRQRVAALLIRLPSRGRRIAGAALVAALMAAGTLGAIAAQPSASEQLTDEVQDVVAQANG
ncbi:MAG: hypothetical protein JWM33_1490 [Caulobacteraceae bacterium]|nr:hypothetical protein [Caulobacteraceae bacterium]